MNPYVERGRESWRDFKDWTTLLSQLLTSLPEFNSKKCVTTTNRPILWLNSYWTILKTSCHRTLRRCKYSKLRWFWTLCTESFLPKVASSSCWLKLGNIKKNYQPLQLQIRVFLAGHTSAMVTNCAKQFFDAMIVVSSYNDNQNLKVLESVW